MYEVAFIGIIADSKNEMQIKRFLEGRLNVPTKEHTVIVINDKSIENIRNIKFQTILVMTLDEIINKQDILSKMLKNAEYLVINSDADMKSLKLINDMKLNVITFGFNQKATITASSVEENLMICVQRKIVDINKNTIESQEIVIKTISPNMLNNAHNAMGIGTILLIYGKNQINL